MSTTTEKAPDRVARPAWYSPAGKKQLAARLVKMITPHDTYTEVFAGSGAVFFAKPAVKREVVNDADPQIVQAYRDLQALTDAELSILRRKSWVGSKALYGKLYGSSPSSRVERLYRFMYVSRFSYGKVRGTTFDPTAEGVSGRMIDLVPGARARLKGVEIRGGHYAPTVKEFDGRSSFHFFDPPYAGTNANVGEAKFDEQEFRAILDKLQGRFLLTYGTKGKLDVKGFNVKRIAPPRSLRNMRGAGKAPTLPTLIVSNYAIQAKALGSIYDDDWEFEDAVHEVSIAKRQVPALKMPDPAFVMRRLRSGKLAGVLSTVDRAAQLGSDQVLVNEPDAGGVRAFGIVRMAEAQVVKGIEDMSGHQRSALDTATLREFMARKADGEGPFYFYPLRLAHAFDAPRLVPGPQAQPAVGAAVVTSTPPIHKALQDSRAGQLARAGNEALRALDATLHEFYANGLAKSDDGRHGGVSCGDVIAAHRAVTAEMDARGLAHAQMDALLQDTRQPTVKARGLGVPQRCQFCLDRAVKALVWADERGYVPVCAFHESKGRNVLKEKGRTIARVALLPKRDGSSERRPGETLNDCVSRKMRILREEGITGAQAIAIALRSCGAPTPRDTDKMESGPSQTIKVIKSDRAEEERFVLGVVLEPEVEDSQGDIYSADEVRKAAHIFMEDARRIGLMHRELLGKGAAILENYIAPVAFTLNGQTVKAGTWLLGLRIKDDSVWSDVKAGRLTGLSIGGSAIRVPENPNG